MARQYFNFDEVWGDRAKESQREMTSAQLNKKLEILKKYGCHIRKIGDTDEDLRKRGELEAYRVYEKSLI